MGASHSSKKISSALAQCDPRVLKYVLSQRSSHVQSIFQRFVENGKDGEPTIHPVMENSQQFSNIFTATNNDHANWVLFFDLLDDTATGYVDFYEAIATVAICTKASVTTRVHLLLQIFDYSHSGVLSRPELLLLLRSSVTGVRKLCGLEPLTTNFFEQLVSHAFATSSSAVHQKEGGMNFIDLTSWVRLNDDVKHYLAAVSPASIHSAQKERKKINHIKISHGGKKRDMTGINVDQQNMSHNAQEIKHNPFEQAILAHRKHCQQYLEPCKELREIYDSMDKNHQHRITLDEFKSSLPQSLKLMAGDMFRAMTEGKYLRFDQMLHEIYPTMTHDEIEMLCSATRKKRKARKKPEPVKLTEEQTEEMYALFDMYNTDHTGHMSVAELTAVLTATGAFTVEECKTYFDLADHDNHHTLSKADFVHFFEDSFIASATKPLFRLHPDDLTPVERIPHEHEHILL